MEYKMLNLFRKNPRQVLTRGQLLEKLWDIDERFVDEHTLTTSISRIRSKIEADGGAPYIKTCLLYTSSVAEEFRRLTVVAFRLEKEYLMKIALINENSQAAKNEMICATLKKRCV